MSHEPFEESLNQLVPKHLDDVLRKNRDQMRLAFATPEEIQELSADVYETSVRHTLTRWQFVVMHVTHGGSPLKSVRLFGWADDIRESWSTSNVTEIDLSHGLVRTANSTYALAGPRATEEQLDLLHVCASLHQWRLGEHFGVPHIFY